MAGPLEDTSEIRVWLNTQLKKEVPDPIWEYLVEERIVQDARDPDYSEGRKQLIAQARKLMKMHGTGADAPKVRKRQPTGKSQKATADRRTQVLAEVAAKFARAKANKNSDASPNGHDRDSGNLTPEQREFVAPTRAHIGQPITGKISNGRITVTAEPWVSPEEVRRRFVTMRDMWFWTLTPSARRVELVSFVTSFLDGYYDEKINRFSLIRGSDWPGWRSIMERWNRRYPQRHDWHYTHWRNLRRDFLAGVEALTCHEDF